MPAASAVGGGVLFPPMTYSPGWAILAIVILALIAAYYLLVAILVRSRRPDPAPLDLSWVPAAEPAMLRQRYLDLIGDVELSHERDLIGTRAAHQKLSLLLRYFAFESSGLRAPQMTLADLRRTRAGPLSDAVARLYPGAFARSPRGSVPEAAELARGVIRSWN